MCVCVCVTSLVVFDTSRVVIEMIWKSIPFNSIKIVFRPLITGGLSQSRIVWLGLYPCGRYSINKGRRFFETQGDSAENNKNISDKGTFCIISKGF